MLKRSTKPESFPSLNSVQSSIRPVKRFYYRKGHDKQTVLYDKEEAQETAPRMSQESSQFLCRFFQILKFLVVDERANSNKRFELKQIFFFISGGCFLRSVSVLM